MDGVAFVPYFFTDLFSILKAFFFLTFQKGLTHIWNFLGIFCLPTLIFLLHTLHVFDTSRVSETRHYHCSL